MLNSGKKFRALRDKKNNILTLVLSEKKFLNETKKHRVVRKKISKRNKRRCIGRGTLFVKSTYKAKVYTCMHLYIVSKRTDCSNNKTKEKTKQMFLI